MKAPVLIVLIADIHLIVHRVGNWVQKVPHYLVDMGIAGEHLILRAQELGLGTCWIGWLDYRKAQKFLSLPKGHKICELIAMGYLPKGFRRGSRRLKSFDQVVHLNSWGNKLSSE
jgi:nitroreductase